MAWNPGRNGSSGIPAPEVSVASGTVRMYFLFMDGASHPGVTPAACASVRPEWAAAGRKLGRYRLGPSLGRGGMGEVVEAWDTVLNRTVAVKVLQEPHPGALLRFMKEAQLQARVSHPNVCRVFDVDVFENVPFIAMQRVQGPNLLEAAPGLALREAVQILADVALAMHAAHRMHLIHRDLKPSNILLERAPAGGWIPYVADFGLAKDLEEDATQTQGIQGTPSYMAPEQRRGEGPLGPPTDVFSLGVTLCVVLGVDREAGFHGLPRNLRRILRRCLEQRPEDRYPTAGALAEDFRRFLDGEPLLGARMVWIRHLRGILRRHPAWTASLAVLLGMGTVLGGLGARQAAISRRRTLLALRFAQDARDVENGLALDLLLPPHDLRPVLGRMSLGLEAMRREVAHLGPEAAGPGNLALGRGYLAMRHLHPALEALEEARKAGLRTPDLALALCETHLEFHRRFATLVDLGFHLPSGLDPGGHLERAQGLFDQAAGAPEASRVLAMARIRAFEGRPRLALDLLQGLLEGRPWFHQVLAEEACARADLGLERQRRGDWAGARVLYREAEAAALEARFIARSDVTGHFAALRWRFHRLQAPHLPAEEALRLLDESEGLVDGALAIRSGSPWAIAAKIKVLLDRARLRHTLGRDPAPDLERADAFLEGATPQPAYVWLISQGRERLAGQRAELGYGRKA